MEQQKISAHHEADIVELQTRQRQTLDRLLAMTQRQHLELWKTLDAPKVQDLNGEFFGVVTTLGLTPAIYSLTYDVMFNTTGISGWWLGKAFRATGETTGEGYNRWQRPGGFPRPGAGGCGGRPGRQDLTEPDRLTSPHALDPLRPASPPPEP